MVEFIRVYWHDTLIGALSWRAAQAVGVFQYTPEFVQTGIELSPLTMPLREAPFQFPQLARTKTFDGLPGLIADSLPEKFGNRILSQWLQRQGHTFDSLTPLERLTYLGSRGMGALRYEPDVGMTADTASVIDVHELVAIAQSVLTRRSDPQTYLDAGLEQLIQVGTSAGGAKAKAVIAWNRQTDSVLSGQVTAPAGYEYWLLKFDGIENEEHATSHQIGRIEMAYHYMAVEAGIAMMECELRPDGDKAHFMTRRFDRGDDGTKYHVQTLSGLTHQDRDPPGQIGYEYLFATARQLGLPQKQLNELYLRMVFNIMARNQDDHAKNHAFIMDNQGQWRISPAYDICYSYKPGSRWIDQHQMRCNNKRDGFTRDDLLAAAVSADVKKRDALAIIEQVQDALNQWDHFARAVDLSVDNREAIRKTFRWLA